MSQVKARPPQQVKKAQPSRRVLMREPAPKQSFGQKVADRLSNLFRSSGKLPRNYPMPAIAVAKRPVRIAVEMPGTATSLEAGVSKVPVWATRATAPKPQIARPVAPVVIERPQPARVPRIVKAVAGSGQTLYMSSMKAPALTPSRLAYADVVSAVRVPTKISLKAASPVIRFTATPDVVSLVSARVIDLTRGLEPLSLRSLN